MENGMQNGRWNGKHVPSLANKASSGRMKLQNGSAFQSGIRTAFFFLNSMGIRQINQNFRQAIICPWTMIVFGRNWFIPQTSKHAQHHRQLDYSNTHVPISTRYQQLVQNTQTFPSPTPRIRSQVRSAEESLFMAA